MHGQVTRPQALLAGFPAGLVVLRADGLQHRDVATERAQVGPFGARQGKAGGVDQHFGTHLVQPGFDLLQAGAFLEAGHGDRQRVEPGGLQALAEHIDERGVGRLQVRAIEQQWRYRLFGMPLRVPVLQRGAALGRVIHGGARQRLRLVPGIVAAQPLAGQAVEQVDGVGLAALAQVVPEAFGLLAADTAQAGQLRVRAVVARHQDQLHATASQLDQLLDAIAPVADAAVQRHQDDLGMA
ncbi:hypothetical protein D3C75_837920 [compost metagenome]